MFVDRPKRENEAITSSTCLKRKLQSCLKQREIAVVCLLLVLDGGHPTLGKVKRIHDGNETSAIEILNKIAVSNNIRTFTGFIFFMVKKNSANGNDVSVLSQKRPGSPLSPTSQSLNPRMNTTGGDTVSQPLVVPPQTSPTGPVYPPVAYHATAGPSIVPPSLYYYDPPTPVSWLIYPSVPPGFGYPSAHSFVPAPSQPVTTSPAQYVLAIVSPTQPATSNPPVRATLGQETTLPHAFTAGTLHDPSTGTWNMDTDATSHLNNFVNSLSVIFNMCGYPFVSVGDGHSIIVTNTGHSILTTLLWSLHLNNIPITLHIVKNLIYVLLLYCDSTGDLFPVTAPFPIPQTFLGLDTAYLLLYIDDIVLTGSSELLLQQILERAHMVGCNLSRNPIDTKSKLRGDGDPVCLYMYDLREPHFSALKRILSLLSRSNAEAEYRGVAYDVADTCWLRNLLRELHTPLSSATLVYCDNVSAVYLFCNPVQHQHTEHIEIDIHSVRNLVAAGEVCILRVPSRYQFADIFTKGLPSALYEEFRTSLSV
nr:ribonuclease H-like domain-containing protein [Tanacetum cinerariifolium]